MTIHPVAAIALEQQKERELITYINNPYPAALREELIRAVIEAHYKAKAAVAKLILLEKRR